MEEINGFSVDLEDWYQGITSLNARPDEWHRYEPRVVDNTSRLLDLFESHQVQVTFFCLGKVAEDHPDLIKRIDSLGHEVGVHGFWHKMVHKQTPDKFRLEIQYAIQALSPLINQPIFGHRAPYFSINRTCLWALDVLQDLGFKYDSSFFPTRNTLYGFPGSPRFPHRIEGNGLVEFPLSTARWLGTRIPIAGGLYLRAYPYKVIQAGIRQINRLGYPAIIYIHPWELDTDHRFSNIKPREWIVQYTRRGSLLGKLERLFSEFKFQPMKDLLNSLQG